MAAYAFRGSGSEARSTTVTSLTASLPSGSVSVAAGDILFLFAKSATNASNATHTVPAGWSQLGAIVRCDAGAGFINRYGALQMWWKTAGSSETAPTVSLNGPGTYDWTTAVFSYRAVSGTPTAKIVAACVDDTTGTTGSSSYTAPAFTSPVGTIVTFYAQVTVSGGLNVTTSQSFAVRLTNTFDPASRVLDKNVIAGTQTMPTLAGSGRPFMSKTFALDRDPGVGEWGLDRIAW